MSDTDNVRDTKTKLPFCLYFNFFFPQKIDRAEQDGYNINVAARERAEH